MTALALLPQFPCPNLDALTPLSICCAVRLTLLDPEHNCNSLVKLCDDHHFMFKRHADKTCILQILFWSRPTYAKLQPEKLYQKV